MQLSSGDELVFWTELESQMKALMSTTANLVINKTAGVIVARDDTGRLDAVERFLREVVPAAVRQVEITARIYEVTLNDDQSLGVDWTQVAGSFTSGGEAYEGSVGTALIKPSPSMKLATLGMDFGKSDGRMALVVKALREQGDIRSVSQPRVMTLNNQPALVKVGTDMPYFSATITTDAATGARTVNEETKIVTVGIILAVTPQISADGWIALGIDPIVSSLAGTATSQYGSTAPIIDIKQSSSLVRLRDRETVRISGLLQTSEEETVRKVPLLGEIPILGAAFRWTYKAKVRKELVIFITPRIL